MFALRSAGWRRRPDGISEPRPKSGGTRRHRLRLLAAMAAMAVLAGACGSDQREETATADESSGSSTVIDPAVFTGEATTVGGDTVDLASLADKDLVVWFWAPW